MVAIQIRDVPDDVRDTLAELASDRGQSMQAYLLTLVTEQARRADHRAVLERFVGRSDGSQLAVSDVVTALDAARAERDGHLGAAVT